MPDTKNKGKDDAHKELPGEPVVGFERSNEREDVVPREKVFEIKEKIEPQAEVESKKLREEIDIIDGQKSAGNQSGQAAQKTASGSQKEKIKKLLLIAEEKGVIYAVNMAKKMDDPYILDLFHDALAEQGFYKKFKK